ncbi:oligosaccharide flippase family protein [Pelagicoccus sp. SDUM812002]|uniref:oligosaccharide flippase family protein n=1 Tax=Pelagicoccus sp. SDUM812002 TaxID=3041266 RepID=UPI00280C8A7F|nr:oligosaccharide flippase family protein [Pelagicoccus sp. SDUM812002]MDQ8188176.1 oligosaccharide flippase family protein [Pelagicoccus sp. SDUM812002]
MNFNRSILSGLFWVGISVVLSRMFLFVSQLAMGILLEPKEFGAFAAVFGVSSFVAGLRNGGLQPYFIKHALVGSRAEPSYINYSRVFNICGGIFIVVGAMTLYRDEPLKWVMGWIIGVAFALSVPGLRLRAQLASGLKFRALGLVEMLLSAVKSLSAVGFALLGFGAVSIALPLLLVPLVEILIGTRQVRKAPAFKFERDWKPKLFRIFTRTRWLIVSSFVVSIVLFGDYFFLGVLVDAETLGIYFFGCQLASAFANLFAQAFQSVLMPSLRQIEGEVALEEEFHRILTFACMTIGYGCMALLLVSPYAIVLFWGDKWVAAIPVAQVALASLIVRLQVPIFYSLLESQGRWKGKARLQIIDAITLVIFVIIGGYLGTLQSIIACVFSQRILAGIFIVFLTMRQMDFRYGVVIKEYFMLIGVGVLFSAAFVFLGDFGLSEQRSLLLAAYRIALFSIIFTAVYGVFKGRDIIVLLKLVKRKFIK